MKGTQPKARDKQQHFPAAQVSNLLYRRLPVGYYPHLRQPCVDAVNFSTVIPVPQKRQRRDSSQPRATRWATPWVHQPQKNSESAESAVHRPRPNSAILNPQRSIRRIRPAISNSVGLLRSLRFLLLL
jgi:hypothetical protein